MARASTYLLSRILKRPRRTLERQAQLHSLSLLPPRRPPHVPPTAQRSPNHRLVTQVRTPPRCPTRRKSAARRAQQ